MESDAGDAGAETFRTRRAPSIPAVGRFAVVLKGHDFSRAAKGDERVGL
jgi:hypothetical protein